MYLKNLWLILFLGWALPLLGDESKTVVAFRIHTPITVDGRLSEPDWQQTSAIADFYQREPEAGRHATFRTEVQNLIDEQNLYIGIQ